MSCTYLDRFFTSASLLDELKEKGCGATGTLLFNKVPLEVKRKLPSDKRMSDAGRGTHVEFARENYFMHVVKWLDKKVIIVP